MKFAQPMLSRTPQPPIPPRRQKWLHLPGGGGRSVPSGRYPGAGGGYFFAGFQPFTWSVPGILAYGGGFAVEAVCLACFFAVAKAFWSGARWHFVAALVAAMLLSTISNAAQVLYLELDALKGAAHIPPGALNAVPIGWLLGSIGGGWVVLGRHWLSCGRGGVLLQPRQVY